MYFVTSTVSYEFAVFTRYVCILTLIASYGIVIHSVMFLMYFITSTAS